MSELIKADISYEMNVPSRSARSAKDLRFVGGPGDKLVTTDHFLRDTYEFFHAAEDNRTIIVHIYVPTHFENGYLICEYRGERKA